MEFKHVSVLLSKTIDSLNVKPDGIYVDGTLGGGGHSFEVLKQLGEHGRLIGIDQDEEAIEAASKKLTQFADKVNCIRNNYSNFLTVINEQGIQKVDGIILDLGVSSHQLDTAERGFSYMKDAPLDMRMDQSQSKTARDIVNGYTELELFRMIRDYGEDSFAKNIAKHIVKNREKKEITTTGELTEIIRMAVPMKIQKNLGHPAKKTFQAIRIECNQELFVLRETLDDMIEALNENGRICVITFHSLEDRIVKNIFRQNENPCICPSNFPICICNKKSKGRVITRKPILPAEEEIHNNARSKSAKLRVFERHYN